MTSTSPSQSPLPFPSTSIPTTSAPRPRPRTAVKRACDACKIRKVRCSNTTPCTCCLAIGIPCTFNKNPSTRGPRHLRAKTILQIAETQGAVGLPAGMPMTMATTMTAEIATSPGVRVPSVAKSISGRGSLVGVGVGGGARHGSRLSETGLAILPIQRPLERRGSGSTIVPGAGRVERAQSGSVVGGSRTVHQGPETPLPPMVASPPEGFVGSPSARSAPKLPVTPVATLVLQLCVYRLRMFPVWPIVAVEDLMAALQKDSTDSESYALANAVAAATIAQLKLTPLRNSAELVTGESMEAEVQRVRRMEPMKLNNNRLRTSFFLHVYHENLDAGGINSLLYLREALTMAQIMGLHKESSYVDLAPEEQQFRRRVLWLLFVTERGVAMLHKLPVILKTTISFPAMEYSSEVSILPAFRNLVNLFWIFDQSGAFEILQNPNFLSSSDTSTPEGGHQSTTQNVLTVLQKRLQDIPIDSGAENDVQAADICVTRAWMRAVLWRMTMSRISPASSTPSTPETSLAYPTQIAKEFLAVISKLPITAIEAHGPSMEFKLYEIACAVVDSISRSENTTDPISIPHEDLSPRDVLAQLQRILASCRGGNETLVSRLDQRISEMNSPDLNPNPQSQYQVQSQTQSHTSTNINNAFPSNAFPSNQDLNAHWRAANTSLQAHDPSDSFFHDNTDSVHTNFNIGGVEVGVGVAEQGFASFPWDALANENVMGFGSGAFGEGEGSTVLDRFLGEGIGDNWSIIRNSSTPVSQWL